MHVFQPSFSFLLIWFVLFWGVFLPFYAGSYRYGVDVRFSLLSYLPLAILAGRGGDQLGTWITAYRKAPGHYVVLLAMTMAFFSFLPLIRSTGEEAWAARADHHYAHEMSRSLPQNSIIFTHNPTMFLLWHKSAAQIGIAVNNPSRVKQFLQQYTGGVYFHYNFWCNVPDPSQNSLCQRILESYQCERINSFSERNYTYILYRITGIM